MTEPAITSGQLKRLQVLYGQLCAHTQQPVDRESRIGWAQALVQRPIASFNDLTQADARHLIDTLQGQLGVAPAKKRKRLDSDAAHKAGTEGRRGNQTNVMTMAGAAEFARIQYALDQIGWTLAQLDAWLRSPRSPLPKSAPQIRTLGDANRVWWALKRMMDRQKRKGRP